MWAYIATIIGSTPPDAKSEWAWDLNLLYLLGLPAMLLATLVWWAYDKIRERRRGW